MKEQIKRLLGLSNSQAVVHMAGKSKCAALTEQLLIKSFDHTKAVLRHLHRTTRQWDRLSLTLNYGPLLLAMSTILALGFSEVTPIILEHQWPTRVGCGVALGFCGATYLAIRRRWIDALLAFSVGMLLCCGVATREGFMFFLEQPYRRIICLTYVFMHVLATLLYAFTWGWDWVFASNVTKQERELERILQQAVEASETMKEKELATLIRDHAPQYATMLKQLKVKDPDMPIISQPIGSPPTPHKSMELPIYMGVIQDGTNAGHHKTIDLAELVHMLIGGTTGAGKSNLLRHIINTLNKLDTVDELVLIDPAEVEFALYQHLPKATFVGGTNENATAAVGEVIAEMERRKQLFLEQGVVTINDYKGDMRRKVILVDEFASFSSEKGFRAELTEVARLGRKYGIHIIVCTQRPDAQTIDRQTRANLPATIALRVANEGNARVLNCTAAAKLPVNRKGLAYICDGEQTLVQLPLAEDVPAGTGGTKPPKTAYNHISVPAGTEVAQVVQGGTNSLPASAKAILGVAHGWHRGVTQLAQVSQSGTEVAQGGTSLCQAEKGVTGAIFISRNELISHGSDPSEFIAMRERINGVQHRGYWVRFE